MKTVLPSSAATTKSTAHSNYIWPEIFLPEYLQFPNKMQRKQPHPFFKQTCLRENENLNGKCNCIVHSELLEWLILLHNNAKCHHEKQEREQRELVSVLIKYSRWWNSRQLEVWLHVSLSPKKAHGWVMSDQLPNLNVYYMKCDRYLCNSSSFFNDWYIQHTGGAVWEQLECLMWSAFPSWPLISSSGMRPWLKLNPPSTKSPFPSKLW